MTRRSFLQMLTVLIGLKRPTNKLTPHTGTIWSSTGAIWSYNPYTGAIHKL